MWNERHSKETANANNESVANHSTMSRPESAKWANACKGTPGKEWHWKAVDEKP